MSDIPAEVLVKFKELDNQIETLKRKTIEQETEINDLKTSVRTYDTMFKAARWMWIGIASIGGLVFFFLDIWSRLKGT